MTRLSKKILVVEDEAIIRGSLAKLLERNGYEVSESVSVKAALNTFNLNEFDLIISDLRLPGGSGAQLISLAGKVPVIIMTSYASLRSAVDIMRQGAVDYISKPFDHEELVHSVNRITNDHQKKTLTNIDDYQPLLGSSPAIIHILKTIHKTAPTRAPVLILGASGCGKRTIARTIHNIGGSADKPFITIDCATVTEDQLKQTNVLAVEGKVGSLFLSNVGELPMFFQKTVCNLVKDTSLRCLISAETDLKERCEEGKFREDLFFAINVVTIQMPTLRDHKSDIPQLAESFLARFSVELGMPVALSPKGMSALTNYDWPGNVRELKNVLYQAAILLEPETLISPSMLRLASENKIETQELTESSVAAPITADLSLEDYFTNFVLNNQVQMSETELAKKLGISRKSLWQRRSKLGINRKKT
ncbi:MAG: sigma-54 dependent transcriptional regulator [Porticoccaceae bacterium]|nr:sigma-54 dependent transcriptional regulator [Porticoccaceae bacterium]|tara:strand:+ start:10826 stop:12085 length:1260 start_codon:yes stop_codon:yes gene_type:complete